MKNNCYLLLFIFAFLVSCENTSETTLDTDDISNTQEVDMSDFYIYTDTSSESVTSKGNGQAQKCFTMNVLNRQLDANPGLYNKMYAIEKHTRQFIAGKKPDGVGNGGGGKPKPDPEPEDPTPYTETIYIPVIVHVIHTGKDGVDDISGAQIQSQIDILNDDFSTKNGDFGLIPNEFSGVSGNTNVQFTLDTNNGITRTHNSKTSWATDNSMKFKSSGGHDVITPETHLNIWVVNKLNNNVLGYAQFPGGNSSTDGVVIAHPFFGNTGTSGSVFEEFNLGRTATHEVGHYLNLRHIWGDGRCRQDDFVTDTPSSDRPNYYCPGPLTSIVHCRSRDMHMNYMDYVDDACMYMFTEGQVDRMRAIFAEGGSRESIVPTPLP